MIVPVKLNLVGGITGSKGFSPEIYAKMHIFLVKYRIIGHPFTRQKGDRLFLMSLKLINSTSVIIAPKGFQMLETKMVPTIIFHLLAIISFAFLCKDE